MPRHKHADVIIAWAEGGEVQYRAIPGFGDWETFSGEALITWCEHAEYRIKPKIVKREGWVNVYPSNAYTAYIGYVFETQEAADRNKDDGRQATIRIEWEEEE